MISAICIWGNMGIIQGKIFVVFIGAVLLGLKNHKIYGFCKE